MSFASFISLCSTFMRLRMSAQHSQRFQMKELVRTLLLLLCFVFELQIASSQKEADMDYIGWWIDCGSETPRVDVNMSIWDSDELFTQAGISKEVLDPLPLQEMNTLRAFPNATDQNYYMFPTTEFRPTLRYVIRSGFYYGNYDDLSMPPTFDLSVNDQKWSTVNTSSVGGPMYQEIVYGKVPDILMVYLVQTRNAETPFISSLEFMPLPDSFYPFLESNSTYTLVNRTNLGGGEIRYTGLLSDEHYNRIWRAGVTPSNCIEVPTPTTAAVENDPPVSVLTNSIVSNTSDPITFTIDVPQETPHSVYYFVFYFTEMAKRPKLNDTRLVDIYVNNQMMQTVAAEINHCKVVSLAAVMIMDPKINITLAQNSSSTLPPIISAMEVFKKLDYEPSPPHGNNSSRAAQRHFSSSVIFISFLCLVAILYSPYTSRRCYVAI